VKEKEKAQEIKEGRTKTEIINIIKKVVIKKRLDISFR
jgi:hypothetical protein